MSSLSQFTRLDDHAWLDVMSDPSKFSKSMTSVYRKSALVDELALKFHHNENAATPVQSLHIVADTQRPEFIRAAIRYGLMYLILSHHRMPNNQLKAGTHYPVYSSAYVNTAAPIGRGIWSKLPAQGAALWADPESLWMRSVARYATRIKEQLDTLREALAASKDAGAGFITAVTHVARCGLIQSDFMVSSDAWKEPERRWSDSAVGWANLVKNERPGQPLDVHLINVGRGAPECVDDLFTARPLLSREIDGISGQSLPEKFKWQIEAERKLAGLDHGQGLIIFLMAGTGSGKTIGAARMLKAVSPNGLRMSVALGLRTLTLQTADSYIHDLGLDESELAMLMGCEVEKAIHQAQQNGANNGTHHGLDVDSDHVIYRGKSRSGLQDKLKIFKDTPVVVSTIDSIIDAAVGARNTGLLSVTRLANSDLIIDEVDSYSESDMVSIAKIVYLVGFFGRKPIISSATTTPEIAEILTQAYVKGYRAGAAYRGGNTVVNVAWVSEQYQANQLCENVQLEHFMDAHAVFARNMVSKLAQGAVKRKASTIPISSHSDVVEAYGAIERACISLHGDHHEVDLVTGKRVSFGLVRLSTVESCKNFALYLSQSRYGDNCHIKLCCYHSQQMVGFQHCYENFYNRILSRKPVNGAPALFSHTEVRDIIDETNKDNVILIMVSSPIEEVGRDHDFDWGIVEPTSMRAIIQTAGRIRRHREGEASKKNLVLLDRTFRSFHASERFFAYPGPETPNEINRDIFAGNYTKDARLMIAMKILEKAVDARECILPFDDVQSELSRRERQVQSLHFHKTDSDPGNKNAISYFDEPTLRFGCAHNELFKFRGNNGSINYADMGDGSWRLKLNGNEMPGTYAHLVAELDISSDRWIYVPTEEEVDARYRQIFRHLTDEEYRKVMYAVNVTIYVEEEVPHIGYSIESGAFKIKVA